MSNSSGIIYKDTNPFISTFGSANLFIGASAGNLTTTGIQNIGIGDLALTAITNGTNNFALGVQSLQLVTTGDDNVAIGHLAGFSGGQPDDSRNTMIGSQVNQFGNGSDNVYVGFNVADNNFGNKNVILGSSASPYNYSMENVVFAGYGAGADVVNSIAIGYQAGVSALNDCIHIGYNLPGTGMAYELEIGNDGSGNATIVADMANRNVGMGAVSPSGLFARLHVGAINNSEVIFRLEGPGGGAGNPTENTHLSKGTTTNATATTIGTYSVSNGYCFQFDTRVVGHRTGGSGGTANDSASYWLRSTFKYTGGAIVQIGTTDKLAHEDQAGWDANWVISGNDLLLQVTGATNNNIAWSSISRVMILNT